MKSNTQNKFAKYLLLILVFVIIVSGVITFIIVFTKTNNKYEESQEQFSGEIQLEGTREEIIEWNDDFMDLNSPQSQALVDKIKPKITSALESEGFNLDKVEVIALEPDDKVNITLLKKTKDRVIDDQFFMSRANFHDTMSPEVDKNLKTYRDVQSVKVKVRTFGLPVKNAAVMGSVGTDQDIWGKVRNSVSSRLRSVGLNTRVKELQPQQDFLDVVEQVIQNDPLAVTTAATPNVKIYEAGCGYTIGSANVYQQNVKSIYHCTSKCKVKYYAVYSGENDVFHSWEKLCAIAYAIGFLNDNDEGWLELIDQGPQYLTTRKAPIRGSDWIDMIPGTNYFQYTVLVKDAGPIINPTTPPPPTQGVIHPWYPSILLSTTTKHKWVKTTPTPSVSVGIESVGNSNTMMVLFNDLYNPQWPKKRENPSQFYSTDHADAVHYRKDVTDHILQYLNAAGFNSVKDEGFYPALDDINRIAFFITINDDAENFVRVIKSLDDMEWGNFYHQMYKDLKINTKRFLSSLRLTKKGKEALEEYDKTV